MTKIIAEIGWNHMGDLLLAEKMIHAAAQSGAAFAKFQTWSVQRLKAGEWDQDGRKDIYKKAEINKDMHIKLMEICDKNKISFLSSVFSIEDAELLKSLELPAVKVPSFEVANKPLLEYCVNNFGEVIVSTGTANESEILDLKQTISNESTTVMHCVSSYPCKIENANLPRLNFLKKHFSHIGYSDHVSGIAASIFSLNYSPKYIEKHFTVDHELPGRDNKFAILPEELRELSLKIEDYNKANTDLGSNYQKIEINSREQYRGRFNL